MYDKKPKFLAKVENTHFPILHFAAIIGRKWEK